MKKLFTVIGKMDYPYNYPPIYKGTEYEVYEDRGHFYYVPDFDFMGNMTLLPVMKDWFIIKDQPIQQTSSHNCECGAYKCGYTRKGKSHSQWCPMYE